MLMRLLARLVPSIYADPHRERICANPGCGQACRAEYCSAECQDSDQADQQVW